MIREFTRVLAADNKTTVTVLRAYNPAFEGIPFDKMAGDKIGGVKIPLGLARVISEM